MSRKTVINVADGRELGHVCDVVFNNCGGIMGFIVPGKKSFFKSITSSDNVFIPWNRIIKIGSDVILTELVGHRACAFSMQEPPPQPSPSAYAQSNASVYARRPSDSDSANYEQAPRYTCDRDEFVPSEIEPSSAQTVYHTDGKPPEY